jgi:hypothetical protein
MQLNWFIWLCHNDVMFERKILMLSKAFLSINWLDLRPVMQLWPMMMQWSPKAHAGE